MKKITSVVALLLCSILIISGCSNNDIAQLPEQQVTQDVSESRVESPVDVQEEPKVEERKATGFDINNVPRYSGSPYIAINNNNPYFTPTDYTTKSFERYTSLDSLGRCGVAYANVGIDIMPTEKRGSIGMVKPSGWHSIKYENVDGKYLYNRCHLIGYQLSAENANTSNLITGTRYLNIQGMPAFASSDIKVYPYQVGAALFATRSPYSKGVVLMDESGLGKSTEAMLVVTQKWYEGKTRILIVVPNADLLVQWQKQIETKYSIPYITISNIKVLNSSNAIFIGTSRLCFILFKISVRFFSIS